MRRGLYVLLGVLLIPTVGLVGDIVTDGKFKSTMSTGAPLEVTSASMVANLNADMVDGVEGTNIYTKAEVDALIAAAVANAGRKRYYITEGTYTGSAALSACGTGYHMASIMEIIDPSSVEYAFDHPSAIHGGGAGTGAPTIRDGWVNTGFVADLDSDVPGIASCMVWTSSSGSHYGTWVWLPADWTNPTGAGQTQVLGSAWFSNTDTCDTARFVWCIED